jgi:putative PIN family toxin of toxin-antitoxin system
LPKPERSGVTVKAVLDTNVWISALLNPKGAPARLLAAFADGSLQVVVSAPLLEELADVLSRPRLRDKYGITAGDIAELLTLIEERAEHVILRGDVRVCRDPDDDRVVETAVRGEVSHLVTGDDDLKLDPIVAAFLADHGVTAIAVAKFLGLISGP